MGKKIEALMGKPFKTSRFTSAVGLAISRLAVLKNRRLVGCKHARDDVSQLLRQKLLERASIRAEQVVKEQNMLDVYVMMEGYCNLLIERVYLLEQERECPEELKEAVSCLIYGSRRCGEFPELQEIREILTSRFGREFADRASELRSFCGVNPTMVQKLSTRPPTIERRMEILREIAAEINIDLDELSSENPKSVGGIQDAREVEGWAIDESFRIPMKTTRNYQSAADAAQAAFDSAAHAAAAARAAVLLSRYESPAGDKRREQKTEVDEEEDKQGHSPGGDVVVDEYDDNQQQELKSPSESQDMEEEGGAEDAEHDVPHADVGIDGGDSSRHEMESSRSVFSRMFGRRRERFSAKLKHVRGS